MSLDALRPPETARRLFRPLGPSYERWAAVLSMGQDARWRRSMVNGLGLAPGATVLDVAAGTGSITRLLLDHGARVVSLDQSVGMLSAGDSPTPVVGVGEQLPFRDEAFDAVTFGYLLRYVDDVEAALVELARVVRSGGRLGMVEFGRPTGVWRPLWRLYTSVGLGLAGRVIGGGWTEVGAFLGPSIDRFASEWSSSQLIDAWERTGLKDVHLARPSLGGGLVMTGTKA